MITPKLEELIHCGKAQYKTWVHGSAGSAKIPVRPNSYIIITDINYQGFIYSGRLNNLLDLDEVMLNSVKQLEIASDKSSNHFVIRDTDYRFDNNDPTLFCAFTRDNFKFDTYLVHTKDIFIRVAIFPRVSNWVQTNANQPAQANDKPQPIGFGINTAGTLPALPTSITIDLGGNAVPPTDQQYIPLQSDGVTPATITTDGYRNQFRTNYELANAPRATMTGTPNYSQFAYPIVNIGYVQINDVPPRHLLSS